MRKARLTTTEVIEKYQTSSCPQLAEEKSHPPVGQKVRMEQRAIEILQNDPQRRTMFIDQVMASINNKLLECDIIP